MDYQASLDYLNSFTNYEKDRTFSYPEDLRLDRMRDLCKAISWPEKAYASLLVAGSKGKGSTACFLSSILRMDDHKVGLYTSPHLLEVRERIQVNGICITESAWIEAVEKIHRLMRDAFWKRNTPTYFEIVTLIAFEYFRNMRVNVAVLEVGMGGLYDSTNVAPNQVAGITAISLEHTDKLGKTLAKIAAQKAGIIKQKNIVVSAMAQSAVTEVLNQACQRQDATFYQVGADIKIEERYNDESGQNFDLKTPFGNFYDLRIEMLGRHQIENAALAVVMAKALEKRTRLAVSEQAIRVGLQDAHWPARMQMLCRQPLLVVDGAHNPASLEACLDSLERHFHCQEAHVIFGVFSDKEVDAMLEILKRRAGYVYCVDMDNQRALKAQDILTRLHDKGFEHCGGYANLEQAVQDARKRLPKDGCVVATGSLYLAASVLKQHQNKDLGW